MYKEYPVTVVIPAFNEEHSIGNVLEDLPEDVVDEVIVVDNGSSDKTAEIAKAGGATVLHEPKKGYGSACLTGIRAIKRGGILVILDADYSDYPEQITRLLDPIVAKDAAFVIGSRVLGKREKGALAPQAYWGNRLATFLMKRLYGFSFTDMGPFRAILLDKIRAFGMEDPNFGWNVEMQVKAIKSGLPILEVPVDYRKRIGTSKISGTISGTIRAGYKIIYSIFKYHRWMPKS